ncbi:MAG: glycosyltransferase [Phycisphaerales bacterium]
MTRLRICQVVAGPCVGGLEKHIFGLVRELRDRHDITVLAPEAWRAGVPEGAAFRLVNLDRWRLDPRAVMDLRRALRETDAQVVHAHASKAAGMSRIAARPLHCAQVATVHGLKSSAGPYRGGGRRVIAVSEAAARRLRLPDTIVIPNGVALPHVPEHAGAPLLASVGAPADKSVVCAVGRMAQVKGFDVLLRAWRGVDATLLLLGTGPELQKLQAEAAALGIGERVLFLGWRDDAPAVQASCDLCVLSSRREGFPLTLVEALQVGTPVVSTRVPGAEDMLPDEFLAPIEDADELATRINAALADLPRVREVFAPIFERARRELTLAAMAQRVEAVYFDALRDLD